MPDELDFERPLLELENRISELRASGDSKTTRDEVGKLQERLLRQQRKVYGGLTPWQRAQIARHPKRPHTLDLFRLLLEDSWSSTETGSSATTRPSWAASPASTESRWW
jgi:Acetyl-CoA carboxylase alpha subunit